MDCPTSASGLLAESETDIDEIGSEAEFPPPLPPQLTRRKIKDEARNILFFFKLIFQF